MKENYLVLCLMAFAILVFTGSIFLGYIDYNNVMKLAQSVFGEVKPIKQFNLETEFRLMIIIFLRNLSVTSLMVITGPFLSILSFLVISVNGYLIGGVFRYSLYSRGLFKSLLLLLPHGSVEIPTFFYAAYISVNLSIKFFRNKSGFTEIYASETRKILTRITPLLLIAAFIEAFITPYVASMV